MMNHKKICQAFLSILFILLSIRILSAQERDDVLQHNLPDDNTTNYNQVLSSQNESATKREQFQNEFPSAEKNPRRPTYVITIHRMIDGGLSSSIQRRVNSAKDENAGLIIFDIDTFGGRLDAAMEISEFISDLKEVETVAFIPHKAISAGALIAISCNDIIMAPEAELGDCEPIVPTAEGGYKSAGEKIQTVLRTKFRKFAEKNGYPVLLAEAMVTSEIEVYRIETEENPEGFYISSKELKEMNEEDQKKIKNKKLIVEEGKLLTMHTREAFEFGFARHIVDDREALFALYEVNKSEVTTLETNWSEEMVRFLEKIAPVLLTIGIIAIYIEFNSPGFGIPGLIGITCFATIFLSKYLVGLAEAPEILIFFAGIALIAVEIFLIPGFGITGIAGILLVFAGLILSFQDFTFPSTPSDSEMLRKNLLMMIGSFLTSALVIVLLLRYMPGIPIFNRLILRTSETPDYGFKNDSMPAYSALVGTKGIAITPLRPSGRVDVGERILDVVTQGDFIDKGQGVEIVKVEGNRIVVKSV
ncbi:MAG: serine protease [Candidatus Kuenenia sp.]|nr:serine protease [Candidatus Kuenenia hertensis]